jgi:ComF family protein
MSAQRLCAACLAQHGRLAPGCQRCALPIGSVVPLCGRCLAQRPAFDRTIAALPYAFPWDGVLRRLKFHEGLDLAPSLAERLADAVLDCGGGPVDAVLPVPLAAVRLRQRGFNQAWEIARRVAQRLRLPANESLLLRTRDTAAQAGLDRAARLRNLAAAFELAPDARPLMAGRRLALVDDVMTTGATADAAAAALRAGGAAAVEVWVVARTPAPD